MDIYWIIMYERLTLLRIQKHTMLQWLIVFLAFHQSQQFFWGDETSDDVVTPDNKDETGRYDYGVGPEDSFFSAEKNDVLSRERFIDYEEDYYGYQPSVQRPGYPVPEPGTIPAGAASLAFVFDITGSMYDDLVQVIEGAAKILATTLARRDKPLYNYVLVPFHDPEIGPITVTTDPDKYQRDLRDLYVQGGGDCPEMSIGAIKAALEETLPNSFIYVFTDARSKDYHLTEKVLTLIQKKQSQVVFVMTGDCGNTSHPGYKAYEQIASTSSGQVFLLKKSQVNQILDWVRVAVQTSKVNLMSVDRTEVDESWIDLPVDSKLHEFTISVSGNRPRIVMKDPDGRRVEKELEYEELLSIKKALIVNVKKPKPGIWKLKITAEDQHTIRITGLSPLNFVHGFSRHPTLNLNATEVQPILGVHTHLLLNATGLNFPGRFTKAVLVDHGANVKNEIPASYDDSHPYLYNLSAFMPPEGFFYIKVTGLDEKGYDFQRMSHTAINAIIPHRPVVAVAQRTQGYFDKPARLTCSVTSIVPFTVQWFRDTEKIGTETYHSESENVTWTIPEASSNSEGTYRCNASNTAGWTMGQTTLDVRDPPPTIIQHYNVSVLPGNDAALTCVAISDVEFNSTWYKPGQPFNNRMYIHDNGSLIIRRVEKDDEGPYYCRAQNEGGYSEKAVWLLVQKAPIVTPVPVTQNFVVGDRIDVRCSSVAYPEPTYVWRRHGEVIPQSNKYKWDTNSGELSVYGAEKSDAGLYQCEATNVAGVGYGDAQFVYNESPRIRVPKRNVLVNNGDTATLRCIAEGIPTPNITWFRGTIELHELSFIQITERGELIILGVQDMDAGEYTCVASNAAGQVSDNVRLEVGSAPVIVEPPSSQGVEILSNITLPCKATGLPPPKVIWRHLDKDVLLGDQFIQLPSGELHIRDIRKADEGMYTCHVENQFGSQDASAFITITGIMRPLIALSKNPRIETIIGRTVNLQCIVLRGNPWPTIMFVKMGERVVNSDRITDDGKGNLEIRNVQLSDEGEYTCVASNVGGNATYITMLDVQVPPKIKDDGVRDFKAIQGKSVRLPCEVTGDPKPQILWTKNGVRITDVDPHYFINIDGSLEIFSADPQDTATYSCTAINVAGLKEKRMTLYVQIPPVINEGPDEYTVIVNNPIQIPCEVSGLPVPDVKWQKGGESVSERSGELILLGNNALRFNSAKVDDAGVYECMASSEAGYTAKFIRLTVQVPPRIAGNHSHMEMTVLVGQNVTLPCEVTGTPWPQILWRKDLRQIDFYDTNHKYHLEEAGNLYIPLAQVSDTARYMCVAENPAGMVTKEIHLIVHDPPRIPAGTPNSAEVIEGNQVVLPCPALGTPSPRVTWYKDGREVTGNEIGVKLLTGGNLQLDHAEAQNAGLYECVARNVAGNATHKVGLTVYLPPRFVDEDGHPITDDTEDPPSESQYITRNGTTRFTCQVDAYPAPQITWYKNDQELREENLISKVRILNEGKVLEIIDVDISDDARYRCVAINLAGETQKDFDLNVQEPPKIDETGASSRNLTVIKDRPIVIECPVTGIPMPNIKWFKDGRELNFDFQVNFDPNLRLMASGTRLEITSAYVTDSGLYKCQAVNPAGEVEREYELKVWVPAQIDGADTVSQPEVIINKTITLHCPASGEPLPKVSWFKSEREITKNTSRVTILDDGWRLQIGEAEISDADRYSCHAKNEAGNSEKYYDLSVLVPPEIDRTGLDLFPTVVENRTVIINCPVTGIPTPQIIWLKHGEEVNPLTSSRIQILSGGRQLRLDNAQVPDTGAFVCQTVNKAGKDKLKYEVQIHIPASIDKSRVNLSPKVVVGRSHTLECPAVGIPLPSIKWFRDGKEIDFQEEEHLAIGSAGQKLVFRPTKVTDTAIYECKAINQAGQDKLEYDLEIYVPPWINDTASTEPNPAVIINDTISLHCSAHGTPAPKIKWLKNGVTLDVSLDERLTLTLEGRTLIIQDAKVPDNGRYTCVASNEAGVADKDFDLDVWVPPYIDTQSLDLEPEVIKGRFITLSCPAMGIPFPDVAWYYRSTYYNPYDTSDSDSSGESGYIPPNLMTSRYREGEPVIEDGRIRFLLSGRQLEIQDSRIEDTAEYTCVATNVAGETSLMYNLNVWVPPSIDDANVVDKPRVIVNRTVLLECPVSGVPPPKVKWLKNGVPLKLLNHMNLLSDGRQLEIVSSQTTDTARYTCIASNEAGELQQNFDLEILVPAAIEGSTQVARIEAVENSTVYLDCPATGIPVPSIMWLKDRVPLLDFPYTNLRELSGGRQLELRNVQVTDQGRYTCQATNVAGQERKAFRLKVLVPPRIPGSRIQEDIAVTEKRTVRMECNPSGDPAPNIVWTKDGKPIDTDNDPAFRQFRIIRGGRILQVIAAAVDDAGLYLCTASNVAGQDRKQFVLQVHVPPSIEDSFKIEDHSVIIGKAITIECIASGVPPPKVIWEREGQLFTYNTNPNLRVLDGGRKLQIYNAQLLDIGGYTCRAENIAGKASKEYLINVLVPPTIEEAENAVAATVNSRTQLRCEALGLPDPEVTWEKDGEPIPSNGGNYRMHRSGTLEFSAVKEEDTGDYKCTAVNEAGEVSRDVTLKVQVPPELKQKGPIHVKVIAGNLADLPCEATGVPKPRIIWQKTNRILTQDSEGYAILDNDSLRVLKAETRDSGIYICVAQNNAGTALGQIRLDVQVPPTIEEQQTEYTVVQDREVILPCRSQGIPTPEVRWEKDGEKVDQSGLRYRVTRSGWLAIPIARTRDAGEFVCIAENEAGKAELTMTLVVHVPPSIAETVRSLVVNEGDKAELLCENTGFPTPEITWIQDGRNRIFDGGRYKIKDTGSLIIKSVEVGDTGSFVCTAKNEAGRDKKEVVLKVQVPPNIVTYPKDQEVTANNRIELECEAAGIPTPSITWKVNGTDYPAAPSVNGRSRLVIDNAMKTDDGTYMCIAENPAGLRRALAGIRVKVPPRVLIPADKQAVTLAERVLLHCPVEGADPPPVITWTKDQRPVEIGDRIQQLGNGSLVIYDSNSGDEGAYKCVATNEAGTSEGVAVLTVRSPPNFKVEPQDTVVESGDTVMMNCVVEGEPKPEITWRKFRTVLENGMDRITILQNQSLRIVAAQKDDTGMYICMARNPLGSELIQAQLTVQVNGHWSVWAAWSSCTVSCGQGKKVRQRECDNPAPANDGKDCRGHNMETGTCMPAECPIAGNWGDWSPWMPCSQTCGKGEKKRMRLCNNPSPQFGGDHCNGDDSESIPCNPRPCPIHGGWSDWTEWRQCSETCGEGLAERFRRCDSPRAQYGGRECIGKDIDRQPCNLKPCARSGNWGEWSPWSMCSLSCNGGKRSRIRRCDNPPPSEDGLFCTGRDTQTDYCNKEMCPVHGNWGVWTEWGDCTLSCGGGQRKRFRQCDDPAPKYNGRPCMGQGQDTQLCNMEACSVDGEWSSWSEWSACSLTCGGGEQKRARSCNQPRYGGHNCRGDHTQRKKCNIRPCRAGMPQRAIGNIIGNINNRDFGPARLDATISRSGSGSKVNARVVDIPGEIGRYLQHLISLLSPIYWTTATEVGEAINGYTLTEGIFRREVQVEFATGEVLRMTHVARGVDSNGILNVDMMVNGNVPILPDTAQIIVLPYVEDYIQTGPGSLYASSSRMFKVNGFSLPYAWNHTITYDQKYGRMPYLVQRLVASDLYVDFDISKEVLQYQVAASIAKGEPSNQCPRGFLLSNNDQYCEDVNECAKRPHVCQQQCQNEVGTFRCSCKRGFKLVDNYRCQDIDECTNGESRCSHYCHNTVGAYKCSCPSGYVLMGQGQCRDVDECSTNQHNCREGQECQNTEGGFTCARACPQGFDQAPNGTCVDRDECTTGDHLCHYNQRCLNTPGGYRCQCERGFRIDGPGRPCVDVDECQQVGRCQHACQNTPGSYRCSCPDGYRLAANGRTCQDIDECQELNVNCGNDKICFNRMGDYACVEAGCPENYVREPRTGYCVLECGKPGVTCMPGARYSDILQFRMVALRRGIPAYQDLVHLIAYNQNGEHLPQTTFNILENDGQAPFGIRIERGKGVVFTLRPLEEKGQYRIKVRAKSYDNERRGIQYQTTFILFISVSAFPY